MTNSSTPQLTLPDYLKEGLDIIFVGINPSAYSARIGHYFATPTNRFWAAVNRAALFPEPLSAHRDKRALEFGVGFTDVVKRAASSASEITPAEFRQGAPLLKDKLLRYQPLIVCFNGLIAYGGYLRYAEAVKERPVLGLQERTIGGSRVFVAPNPSPANAAFSLEALANWYRQLKVLRDRLKAVR